MDQLKQYDAVVIGAGLSGLTAASLLGKRGLRVAVVEHHRSPGGSCGAFKRGDALFDQGSAMLFGFGEKGFNAHRFVFNCLEEPFTVLKHELLYCVNFRGHRIRFYPDIELFSQELGRVFPNERDNIRRFYRDMEVMYRHVMVDNPAYTTPDETDKRNSLKGMRKHPLSYARFLSYLNLSAGTLLKRYFKDPDIFNFFDKLTSTYCYTTLEESPAVLAAVMFVDNHVGGSWYPAGSTLFLPGALEKVIEQHGGEMFYGRKAEKILTRDRRASGVRLADGSTLTAKHVIYSGTVWNLYEQLLPGELLRKGELERVKSLVPTYPSVVLYALVDKSAIPEGTAAVEMLANPDTLDEREVTVYIPSVDDRTLCEEDCHVIMAIGPSFDTWIRADKKEYLKKKEHEKSRLLHVLEGRFPGISRAVRLTEIATPATIERYTLKNGGAVAGPKQMLGQHLLKRPHTRGILRGLYLCGESTVMGTGTPTVTTSGISAANAVLAKEGLAPFRYQKDMPNFVTTAQSPMTKDKLYSAFPLDQREVMTQAMACRFCEHPSCSKTLDVPGMIRRAAVGNIRGAAMLLKKYAKTGPLDGDFLDSAQRRCVRCAQGLPPAPIAEVCRYLQALEDKDPVSV